MASISVYIRAWISFRNDYDTSKTRSSHIGSNEHEKLDHVCWSSESGAWVGILRLSAVCSIVCISIQSSNWWRYQYNGCYCTSSQNVYIRTFFKCIPVNTVVTVPSVLKLPNPWLIYVGVPTRVRSSQWYIERSFRWRRGSQRSRTTPK